MKTCTTYTVVFCLFLITVMMSCSQPLNPVTGDAGTPDDQSSGSLIVSFGRTGSKNLIPAGDLAISSFDLILTKDGSTSIEQDGLTASTSAIDPIVLTTGVWTVTVNGRNEASELIASGTSTATIKPAETTSVSITVIPLTGNGILSLTATLGSGVALDPSVAGTLVPVGGGSAIDFSMTLSSDKSSASYETATIPAGWYTLTITLSDGSTVVARSEPEAVQIAEGRRTQGPIHFAFDPSLGRVVVSITLVMDEPIAITFSGNRLTLVTTESMTVNASTSELVQVYQWYLDNVLVSDVTGPSLTVQGSVGVGNHRLGLVVGNVSKVASSTVFFTVTPSIPTYTITYNGNDQTEGTAPSDSTLYLEGDSVVVLGNTGNLTKTALWFAGWNSMSDGTGTNYAPGETFAMGPANVTLYSKWMSLPNGTQCVSSFYKASDATYFMGVNDPWDEFPNDYILYKSLDSGSTWTGVPGFGLVTVGSSAGVIQITEDTTGLPYLVVTYSNASSIYSYSAGTWVASLSGMGSVCSLAFTSDGVAWGAGGFYWLTYGFTGSENGNGLYRFKDGVKTIKTMADGLLANNVRAAFVDSADQVFFATDDGLVKITDNDTMTFEVILTNTGILETPPHNYVTTVTRLADGRIMAGTWNNIEVSSDEGLTWQTLPGYTGAGGRVTNIEQSSNGTIWIGTTNPGSGIHRSTDNGITWVQLSSTDTLNFPGDSIVSIRAYGNEVWVSSINNGGSTTGFAKTLDNGATWQTVAMPEL